MTGVLGAVLVLAGVLAMAYAPRLGTERQVEGELDRISPIGLFVFLTGCLVVGAGAILVTAWYLD